MKTMFRTWPIAVVAAVVATASLTAAKTSEAHADASATAATAGAQVLREAMRKLWSDHVFWTREYVVAAIDGPPEAAAAAASRLMRNQEDIGNAVAAYYGAAAGNRLTSLLKQHIQIAVELVAAAKVGEEVKTRDADARWKENADEIAAFLNQANPNWPRPAIAEAMRMHLETTTAEVLARLHRDYAKDVASFDAVYDHMLHMADVLAEGIVKQFPARFAS